MKQDIRKKIITQVESISKSEQIHSSIMLLDHLMPLLQSSTNIAIYHAHGWELSLDKVVEYSLSQNKHLYQPIAYKNSQIMQFAPLQQSHKAIFYPDNYQVQDPIKWYNLDLILLPLVAVDAKGYRLGRGGGYYDCTLANAASVVNTTILCGVGFDCQLVENVYHESWDIKLDYMVSPNALYLFEN